MYNSITIAGYIGADIDVENKTLSDNEDKMWARLSIATSHQQKKGEEWVDVSTWHTAFVNGKRVNSYVKGIKKGDLVLVEGMMRNSNKEGKESEMFISADKVKILKRKNEKPEEKKEEKKKESSDEDDLPF